MNSMSRNLRRRNLRCETLERRNLLAAGLGVEHNFLSPEDVDGSGDVTPYDALQVINNLNRQNRVAGQGEGASVLSGLMLDVDADGHHLPADVWTIINYLNRNGIGSDSAPSLVPVENRIQALESVLNSSSVPSWLGNHTASDLLSSLHSGVLPELNTHLQSEIQDALQRFDLQSQYNHLTDKLSSLGSQLNSFDSVFSEIGSNLSSEFYDLKNELSSGLGQIHQQAEQTLDALFGSSSSSGSSNSSDLLLPFEVIGDTFSNIGSDLSSLYQDLSNEIHQVDYSSALHSLESAFGHHLSGLFDSGWHWFDSMLVDQSQEFSQWFSHFDSIFSHVGLEIENAISHVANELYEVGSRVSHVASYLDGLYDFPFHHSSPTSVQTGIL